MQGKSLAVWYHTKHSINNNIIIIKSFVIIFIMALSLLVLRRFQCPRLSRVKQEDEMKERKSGRLWIHIRKYEATFTSGTLAPRTPALHQPGMPHLSEVLFPHLQKRFPYLPRETTAEIVKEEIDKPKTSLHVSYFLGA